MPGPWGKAIEALRVAKRLTRATVAKRAKMTATTYGRIERGQHTQTKKLQDIADVFGVPIERVLQIPHLHAGETPSNTPASPKEAMHGGVGVPSTHDVETLVDQIEARLRAKGLVDRVQRPATRRQPQSQTRRRNGKSRKKIG